jgi:sulfur carrier protein
MTTADLGGEEPRVNVVLNGEACVVASSTTLEGLVALMGVETRGVAIAVDGQVVPRSAWPDLPLVDGAHIEVVTAAAGG